MIEEREAVCMKKIDTAETPEIHQKELEMIQTSKQLLTQIIATGKIPQDIVEDKVTNEDDSNYHVNNKDLEDDSPEIDNKDQADDSEQTEDDEHVDDSDQAKHVDGADGNEADEVDYEDIQSDKVQDNQEHDDLEVDEENAHGNNEVAVPDEAETTNGNFTEDVFTQAQTDDGLLTQARTQFETEDEIADYQVAFNNLNLILFVHNDFN